MSMRRPRPTDTAHQGQTLVLFALLSLLLLAGLGLIFDAGLDYRYRRTMQNAADTAALRGARIISQQKLNEINYPSTTNPNIDTSVRSTAVANGVPNASDVVCEYLSDASVVLSACTDSTIPSSATGVRVRVSETHTPLVMRALGVTSTGTAASAAAQVQIMKGMDTLDAPLMVCGVDTATVGGGSFSILTTEVRHDPEPSGPGETGTDYVAVPDGAVQIVSGAYSYDWNQRDVSGNFVSLGGPQFIIYGDNIEQCGFGSTWKGLRQRPVNSTRINLLTDGSFKLPITRLNGTAGGPGDASPSRSINGTQGCKAGAYPDDCIMILPIGHNEAVCPSQCFFTDVADLESTTSIYARVWGAFYIEQNGSNEYYARLIKNYPLHTDGLTGWNPSSYVGPINVTLITTP